MFKVFCIHTGFHKRKTTSRYGKMMNECVYILTTNQSEYQSCTLSERLLPVRWSLFVTDFSLMSSFCVVAWYYKYTSGISEPIHPSTPTSWNTWYLKRIAEMNQRLGIQYVWNHSTVYTIPITSNVYCHKTMGVSGAFGTLSIKNIDDDKIIAHGFFGTCSYVPELRQRWKLES